MTNKNDLLPYAEQVIIEQPTAQQFIQKILNKFKQPVPDKFVELKVEEGNYQFSTNPKWKDKVLCERYGFYKKKDNSEKKEWIQIDIPHTLLETLEITKGEDIIHPLYLDPQVLEKFSKGEHIRGAITIENEEEIFIDKPVSKNSVEKVLIKRLKELEELREKVKGLEENNGEKKNKITDLEKKLKKWEKTFSGENADQVQTRINNLKNELQKEQNWLDKWITSHNYEMFGLWDEGIFGSTSKLTGICNIGVYNPMGRNWLPVVTKDVGIGNSYDHRWIIDNKTFLDFIKNNVRPYCLEK